MTKMTTASFRVAAASALCLIAAASSVLLASDAAVSSTQPSAAPAAEWKRLERMTHDMSRLLLAHIADHPHAAWVIARIIPEHERPIPDPTLKVDEDGIDAVVQSPAAKYENVLRFWTARSGRVHVLDDLGVRHIPDSLFFEVTRSEGDTNDGPHYRGLGEELYDVFNSPGGVVVCTVREERLGRDEFLPALLIPEKWERSVVDAVLRVRENPSHLELAGENAESRRRMIEIGGDANPVMAIAAFRMLMDRGAIAPERAAAFIVAGKGDIVRQATQTLLLLRRRPPAMERYDRQTWNDLPKDIDRRLQALVAVVDASAGFGDVRGIALGAYVRAMDPPTGDPYWKAGRELLDHLVKKAAVAKLPTADDQYLRVLLEGLMEQIDRHQ